MTKTHRFIGPWQIGRGTLRIDDADLTRQMRSVLKLAVGEQVVLGDGTGLEATSVIREFQGDAVVVEVVSVGRNAQEPQRRVTLYCAILKADHFELAAQKATEVGVAVLTPLVTARTVKTGVRVERVRKIVREAAEQSGRGIVPEIRDPMSVDDALMEIATLDYRAVLDPSGEPIGTISARVRTAGLLIGPEGGWTPEELDRFQSLGIPIVSLGKLILRAETAVTVGAYLVAQRS